VKITKLTTIRSVKREAIVLRNRVGTVQTFCRICESDQPMISANQAAQLLNLSERKVFLLVEQARFHIFETEGGRLFICFDSLLKLKEKGNYEL